MYEIAANAPNPVARALSSSTFDLLMYDSKTPSFIRALVPDFYRMAYASAERKGADSWVSTEEIQLRLQGALANMFRQNASDISVGYA